MELFSKILAYVILVANTYVGVLYIKAPSGDRNDHHVIKSRITRVTLITLLLTITAPYILTNVLGLTPDLASARSILGLTSLLDSKTQISILKTLLLFTLLFIGPIFEHILDFDSVSELHNGYLGLFRDVFVAPITEELVYSSLSLSPFLAYRLRLNPDAVVWSPNAFVNDESILEYLWLTPLLFGFAHLHHFYNMVTRTVPRPVPFVTAIVIVSFQFVYTSLFGYLTNRILINTGDVWCCIIAHAFCNWLGFPTLDLGNRHSILLRIIYWFMLLAGAWGFCSYFYILSN